MKTVKGHKASLDAANIQLGRELWTMNSSLAIYTIIGLNAARIECGRAFFGHIQNQSLAAVALGLSKIFEREKRYELCSIGGVYRLAQHVPIQEIAISRTFVAKYGIKPSGDWKRDVDQVLSKQWPTIRTQMRRIDTVRHTRIAHLQQNAPVGNLPSIAAFEDLLGFAFDFHSFVNGAFLNTHSHPILEDKKISGSLSAVLKKIGVSNVVSQLKDI